MNVLCDKTIFPEKGGPPLLKRREKPMVNLGLGRKYQLTSVDLYPPRPKNASFKINLWKKIIQKPLELK